VGAGVAAAAPVHLAQRPRDAQPARQDGGRHYEGVGGECGGARTRAAPLPLWRRHVPDVAVSALLLLRLLSLLLVSCSCSCPESAVPASRTSLFSPHLRRVFYAAVATCRLFCLPVRALLAAPRSRCSWWCQQLVVELVTGVVSRYAPIYLTLLQEKCSSS
jgi:hypothetical protein